MEITSATFPADRIFSPSAAAAHLRRSAPGGRSPIGARFFRRAHAEGRVRAISRHGGRLLFLGRDLNGLLEELSEVAGPLSDRVQARVDARIRLERALEGGA